MLQGGSRRDFASAALIEGLRVEVPIATERVLDYLEQVSSRLSLRPEDAASEWHWLAIECWRVSNGRLVVGGVDQHELWARALPWFGRQMSRALSLGAYHELMLSIPGVQLGSDGFALVVGMVTDSRLAKQIDHVFGYGFNKSMGSFQRATDSRWRIDAGTALQLDVNFEPQPLLTTSNEDWLNERWTAPLLGCLGPSSLIGCQLERRVNPADAVTRDANGVVSVGGAYFDPWLPRATAKAAPEPRAAVFCCPTRISFPRSL